jgi:hypothetical protein
MLATDKCYDSVRGATGDSVQKRTTYSEIATPAQMPTETCNIHGEPRPPVVAEAPSADAPRAQLAANLSAVKPVVLKSSTLLAENDPYNSVKSVAKIDAAPEESIEERDNAQEIDNSEKLEVREESRSRPQGATRAEVLNQKANTATTTDDGKPILKAIPVQPQAKETPVEIRRAVPVGPMDEVEEGTLLKAGAPSPNRPDDE